ncbi:hypothetical protein RND81_12G048400 [Saponaria officinalis]|uniref:Uncharacterized protein n=1 Tax=Saponaria officinalis TaxID=3572 RepID=A0AAW1H799_SAPOF
MLDANFRLAADVWEQRSRRAVSEKKEKAEREKLTNVQDKSRTLDENLHELDAKMQVLQEEHHALENTLAKAFTYASWESKIKCIKQVRAGLHADWDLKEEERPFAKTFSSPPDMSALANLSDSDDDEGSSEGSDGSSSGGAEGAASEGGAEALVVPVGEDVGVPAEKEAEQGGAYD